MKAKKVRHCSDGDEQRNLRGEQNMRPGDQH
jgi:hypothetical protein